MGGLYLYGIVGFPPPLRWRIQGLAGNPVFLVTHGDLAAVVSRSPVRPWPPDAVHLSRHEAVVEEVMGCRAILPVRFNTILAADQGIFMLLEERAREFRASLERVAGKVEMGLRVLWEPPRETEASDAQEAGAPGPGTQYLRRKLTEERRSARTRAAGERLIQELHPRFHSLAVESRLQRFLTDRLLLSGAYLVERYRVGPFQEAVAKAREELSRLRFLLTGPWPPYHFVNGGSGDAKDRLGA